MRVKVNRTGLYTYPDIVALYGEAEFDDEQRDTLVNPIVIIEVLSKSPEGYDRGEKFTQYRKIASLVEYVLIAQDKQCIEPFRRQPDNQWLILPEISEPQAKLELRSIQCALLVADVYDKV
jgi:Uma2 family endonuclease